MLAFVVVNTDLRSAFFFDLASGAAAPVMVACLLGAGAGSSDTRLTPLGFLVSCAFRYLRRRGSSAARVAAQRGSSAARVVAQRRGCADLAPPTDAAADACEQASPSPLWSADRDAASPASRRERASADEPASPRRGVAATRDVRAGGRPGDERLLSYGLLDAVPGLLGLGEDCVVLLRDGRRRLLRDGQRRYEGVHGPGTVWRQAGGAGSLRELKSAQERTRAARAVLNV